jgi:hypothetical protein
VDPVDPAELPGPRIQSQLAAAGIRPQRRYGRHAVPKLWSLGVLWLAIFALWAIFDVLRGS